MLSRTSANLFQVTVLGAAGGIGQSLSLLLKLNPLVGTLHCYDIVNAVGVATDLSHVCTPAKVVGFGDSELAKSLEGSDVVVIAAGIPRKPNMTRNDLLKTNASIVKNIVSQIAISCPKAITAIITNPVNSIVPMAAEVLKNAGTYDQRKLFGITTLDIVRSKTFLAGNLKMNPYDITASVIGGHSGTTIVPLLGKSASLLSKEAVQEFTKRVQFGGDEVVKAKAGSGSATLSMAYAGAEFTGTLLKALRGDKGLIECSYVQSTIVPSCSFFSSRVELGKEGIEKVLPIGEISEYEQSLLDVCIGELSKEIAVGVELAKN